MTGIPKATEYNLTEWSTENVLTWLTRAMPNADQIQWLVFGAKEIRFKWFGTAFRVSTETGFTEEIDESMLVGSNVASLIGALLKKQFTIEVLNHARN